MTQHSPAAPAARTRARVPDRLIVRDPGWAKAHMGWRTLLSLIAGMAAADGVARALGVPGILGPSAGALIGFISGVQVPDQPTRKLAVTLAWFAPAFAVGLAGGMLLYPHHALGLVLLVVVLALSVYLDRFGHRGHHVGTILFVSYLIGLLSPIPHTVYPRVVLAAVAAVVAVTVVRVLFCRLSPRRSIRQTRRALEIAAGRAAGSVADVLDARGRDPRATRRLQRDLSTLNTLALTFDGRLAHPVVDGRLAEQVHRRMFDVEQILVAVAELCAALVGEPDPAPRRAVAAELRTVAQGTAVDGSSVRACAAALRTSRRSSSGRTADLLELIADELDAYGRVVSPPLAELAAEDPDRPVFAATVPLEGARPAGLRMLARTAAASPGDTGGRRRRPSPAATVTIQMSIAAAIALGLGYLFDPEHYYWAVIGVLIVGAPTHTPHERVTKVVKRAVGTVAGALLGLGIHALVGAHTGLTVGAIVAFLAVGAYFITTAYAVFVGCLVTALTQLYGLAVSGTALDVFLVHRLVENVVGGAVMLVVTLVVLPMSTRAVAAAGLSSSLDALSRFLDHVAGQLTEPETDARLRSDARAVDHALFQTRQVASHLLAVPTLPLRPALGRAVGAPSYRQHLTRVLDGLTDASIQVRRIAHHAPRGVAEVHEADVAEIREILGALSRSAADLGGVVRGRRADPWAHSEERVAELLGRLPSDAAALRSTFRSVDALDVHLASIAAELGARDRHLVGAH